MKKYTLEDLIRRYPVLDSCKNDIMSSYYILEETFSSGNKLLIAGNGGSSADAEHIVGELMKGFKNSRPVPDSFKKSLFGVDSKYGELLSSKLQCPLQAISLSNATSLNTAFINDVDGGGELLFAQQVYGYGKKGDTLLAISTSGNSKNVLLACVVAKAIGMKVIALTGKDGGKIKELADVSIIVPCEETFMIQELHLPIYHYLCLALEDKFYGNKE